MNLSVLICTFCVFTVFVLQCVVANKIDTIQLYAYYNAQQHNTRSYETVKPDSSSDLVIRRGGNVYLAVRLTEPYDEQNSQLYARILFGNMNYQYSLLAIYLNNFFNYSFIHQNHSIR